MDDLTKTDFKSVKPPKNVFPPIPALNLKGPEAPKPVKITDAYKIGSLEAQRRFNKTAFLSGLMNAVKSYGTNLGSGMKTMGGIARAAPKVTAGLAPLERAQGIRDIFSQNWAELPMAQRAALKSTGIAAGGIAGGMGLRSMLAPSETGQ